MVLSLKSKYNDYVEVYILLMQISYFYPLLFQIEFLDFKDTMELFEETGLFYAKPIFRGSMNDTLNFPNEFESQIPAQLGLPPLPKGRFIFISH